MPVVLAPHTANIHTPVTCLDDLQPPGVGIEIGATAGGGSP